MRARGLMDASEILVPALTLLLGAGGMGGAWAYLSVRAKVKADAPAAMVNATAAAQVALNAFQVALSAEATRLMGDLRAEVAAMTRRNDLLEARIEVLEGENQECRGENSQLQQDLASLKRTLNEAGIPIPVRPPPGSFTVIEGDRTTTMTPNPKAKETRS